MPSIETIAGSLHDIGHPNEDHDKRAVEKMFMNAMLGKWPAVADTYANRKAALVATIIHTGDTVLHLAVSSRVEFNVTLLMGNIPEERFEEILGMGNDRGDTPLHLAAALGMKKTCSDMATRCPKLVTQARDEHGETPLFKAARHGQKEAFGAMRHAAPDARSTCDLHFCRKFGGDTILHVALLGEHYDLALEIIRCYPCLVEWANEKGVLPIHILASKPFAFESETSFFSLFKKRIYQWYRFRQRTPPNERDPEKREDGQANRLDSETRNFRNVGRRRFQRNCDALFYHFGSGMRYLLLLFGITGLWMTAIEAKKQRKIHVCARQIMIELLKDHREWDFGSAGRNPDKKRSDWLRLSRFSPEAVEVRRVATGFPTEESKGPSEEKQLAPSNEGPVGAERSTSRRMS